MGNLLIQGVHEHPIIAAIKNLENLDEALASDCQIIFLLAGTILNLKEVVERIHAREKHVFIHFDLMDGLSKDAVGLDYLLDLIPVDGIITTRASLVKHARKRKVFVVQRLFVLDSLSLDTGIRSLKENRPDAVELLPGIMNKVTAEIAGTVHIPVITGGLIKEKNEVMAALKAGAVGVSSTNREVWKL